MGWKQIEPPCRHRRNSACVGFRLPSAVLVASALVSLIVVSGAFGSVRVGMKAPRRVAASGLVVLSGRVRGVRNARVEVQRRVGSRWRVVATGMTGGRGVFDLTWVAPVRAGVVRVRVAVLRSGRVKGVSVVRRIKVRARRGPKVVVSPKTQVLAAPTVSSVPKAGKRGVLRFSGGNSVRVGQIVAIGQGKSTPDGFLGRVIAVEQRNGQTVVSTVPATLQQAIPTGSFNETVGHAQAARVQRAAQRAFAHAASSVVSCHGSVGGSVDASLSFGASLELSGSWSVFSGLQSASLTTGAHASASLSATLGGAGSCSLSPHTIARFEGPAAAFLVGPVPVVITSLITVDVDASASAQANVATGITGGFSAQAGIGWHKSGGFYPIEDFTPSFGYTPPTVSSNASVQANVTPKIDVLLYGAAGPQLALKTGLSFNADKNANPWWTLTAPVDVTASLDIPALNLSSPSLHIYQQTFVLATGPGTRTTATDISGNGSGNCALLSNRHIDCWGDNTSGELGDGGAGNCPVDAVEGDQSGDCSTVPVPVSTISNAIAVAGHCALLSSAHVDCWGANDLGWLGNGSSTGPQRCKGVGESGGPCSRTPVSVSGISNAIAVSGTCALLSTHHIDCWGDNGVGQLGDGTSVGPQKCAYQSFSEPCSTNPVAVAGIANAIAISNDSSNTPCALLSTHHVVCWGDNGLAELGDGTSSGPQDCAGEPCSTTPVAVSGITDAIALSGQCAILITHHIACWGYNGEGRLGDGSSTGPQVCGPAGDSFPCSKTPVAVREITNATGISAGGNTPCALLSSGHVQCWGDGLLGNGAMASSATPVTVSGITNATAISTGGSWSCALLSTGGVDCWGDDGGGTLGDGTITNFSTVPVAVKGIPY